MNHKAKQDPETGDRAGAPVDVPSGRRVVPSEEILGGDTAALISHHGELYTLRITRQGKLVLNK